MTYYFDHQEEIQQELIAEYRDSEDWKQAHPTSLILLIAKATEASYWRNRIEQLPL